MVDFPSYGFTGRRPAREQRSAPSWDVVTDSFQFSDGGRTFNEVADKAPTRWDYEVECVASTAAAASAMADVYEDFYSAVRHSQPFNFTDKFGVLWSDVRVESFERRHDAHKSWVVFVNFVLVSYQGVSAIVDYDAGEAGGINVSIIDGGNA